MVTDHVYAMNSPVPFFSMNHCIPWAVPGWDWGWGFHSSPTCKNKNSY